MRKLYIYGTLYNNAQWLEASIRSIEPLNPELIVIRDAGSTDNFMEIINKLNNEFKNIVVLPDRTWCKRGKGRQDALDYIYKIADDDDFAMYIDFDTIYKKEPIDFIRGRLKTIKTNELSYAMLCDIRTNKKAEWRDLQIGEDWERVAHLKSQGVKILEIPPEDYTGAINSLPEVKKYSEREIKRYRRSKIRLFLSLIDGHRGMAYKNWTGDGKTTFSKSLNLIAHFLAILLGIYSYDKKLNNREYALKDCNSDYEEAYKNQHP